MIDIILQYYNTTKDLDNAFFRIDKLWIIESYRKLYRFWHRHAVSRNALLPMPMLSVCICNGYNCLQNALSPCVSRCVCGWILYSAYCDSPSFSWRSHSHTPIMYVHGRAQTNRAPTQTHYYCCPSKCAPILSLSSASPTCGLVWACCQVGPLRAAL